MLCSLCQSSENTRFCATPNTIGLHFNVQGSWMLVLSCRPDHPGTQKSPIIEQIREDKTEINRESICLLFVDLGDQGTVSPWTEVTPCLQKYTVITNIPWWLSSHPGFHCYVPNADLQLRLQESVLKKCCQIYNLLYAETSHHFLYRPPLYEISCVWKPSGVNGWNLFWHYLISIVFVGL